MATANNVVVNESTAWLMPSARQGGAPRFLDFKSGPTNAPMNVATARVQAACVAYVARIEDLMAARGLTPVELGNAKRERSGPYLTALQSAALEVAGCRASLEPRLANARIAAPFAGLWSIELVRHANAMTPIQRAALVVAATHDPLAHQAVIGAWLEAPRELSGLTAAQVAAVRVALFKAVRPGEYATLELERQMLTTAESAIKLACGSLSEGSDADLTTHAPAAFAMAGVAPLEWVPPTEPSRHAVSASVPLHVDLGDAA